MNNSTFKKPVTKYASSIIHTVCEAVPEGYQGVVDLVGYHLRFKIKNVVSSIAEGNIEISIEPQDDISSRNYNFHVKAYSDSNKDALAKQLKLAFFFPIPWVLVVNEIYTAFIAALHNQKQSFTLSEITEAAKGWLFEPFAREHSINILFGMGSAGKTTLALYLSILFGLGKSMYGLPAKQGHTLLVDYENDATEWRDNMLSLLGQVGVSLEETEKFFHYYQSNQTPLYDQVEKIKDTIREKDIQLVIVDSASMASGDSTSDEASALKLMAALKLLNTTVILIAHQRKNEGDDNPIGSIQYFNQARNIWHIEGICDEINDNIFHIGCTHRKNNSGKKWKKPIGFAVTFKEGSTEFKIEDAIFNFEEKFTINDRIKESLKSGGKSYQQLAEELGLEKKHVSKQLSQLKKKGIVMNLNDVWTLVYN